MDRKTRIALLAAIVAALFMAAMIALPFVWPSGIDGQPAHQ